MAVHPCLRLIWDTNRQPLGPAAPTSVAAKGREIESEAAPSGYIAEFVGANIDGVARSGG